MKIARYYQTEAAEALFNAVKDDPNCHPIAAIPTGSGKTMVMSEFIDLYLTHNPTGQVLVLSHVKEILEQNHDALTEHFEGIEIGLYSAGLDSRTIKKITVAGIQSVYTRPKDFKGTNIVIIDECHLVNARGTGMYRQFLQELNSNYVGLTATHFRTGHGYIHIGDDALFNSLVYNKCDIEGFNELISQGFLCKLIAKGTDMKLNTDGLKTRMNDYVSKDMSDRFDREFITNKAVKEIIEYGNSYVKWLVFAIDIKHAEHVADRLNAMGIPTGCVHSKMETNRDVEIGKFKRGEYRCLVNVDILTTGFDAPDIDLIAMLRPTQSPILHIQSLGRGMRIADGKEHCLVLDFAGNVARLGPINDVEIVQKGPSKGGGEARMKECPECMGYLHIAAKECEYCGYVFPVREKIQTTAATDEIIRSSDYVKKTKDWYPVLGVAYSLHTKFGSPNMMKVSYMTQGKTFNEYVCFEHRGFAGHKAKNWVNFRMVNPTNKPVDTDGLIALACGGGLKEPAKVLVDTSGRFPVISDVEFKNG